MKILVTGFTPFGGETINPAWLAVQALPEAIGQHEICKAEIPTEFVASRATLTERVNALHPDAVICVGQAGVRNAMTVERVAINIMDTAVPDNCGFQPVDIPIVPNAAAAYFSTLPIKRMVEAIRSAGLPAKVSNTAGTYICNTLMYHLLHLASEQYPTMLGGFIHVPYAEEQVKDKPSGTPFMTLENITLALTKAIEAIEE